LSAEGFKTTLRGVLNPLVGWLVALDVSPDAITAAGLVISGVAGLVLAAGEFFAGAIVLLIGAICDVLDGMVARSSGRGDKFGAVFDSSADRVGESFVFGGLLYYYGAGGGARESGPAVSAYVVFAALLGSYMVSYVRGRAEGAGLECKVGLMERPERLTVLIAGTLLGPTVMTILLWPLALLANITALHRLVHVRGLVKGGGPPARGAEPAFRAGQGEASAAAHASLPGQTVGGLFVTLEGVEGSGKTTQIERVRAALEEKGHRVTVTREPGGTRTGEDIRQLLLDSEDGSVALETELLLYMASRAQHVKDFIRPALQSGAIVLCDRFSDATVAYQSGGRGVPEGTVSELNELATGGVGPNLTVLLDIPAQEGLSRAEGRGGDLDRMEREGGSFLKDVRGAYLEIARREPDRVKVLDAKLPIEKITEEIVAQIDAALAARGQKQ
jgi:dTMP kinase